MDVSIIIGGFTIIRHNEVRDLLANLLTEVCHDVSLEPHLQASSNRTPLIASSYRRHEQEKRRVYEQRVREIEHATFAPFVMSSTGGIGPCATVILKRLGGLLAEKHAASYSSVMGLLRCRLSFALLRSSIMCIRGSRSSRWHPGRIDLTTTDLAVSEGNVSLH